MKQVQLANGETVPALGQGTWHMGERARERNAEIRALRAGLDQGLTLIDSAEMYGDGEAERIIAEALQDRRQEAFLVSKVYPHNATRKGIVAACERSLQRLATDRLDLYLLHWRGQASLPEVVAGFQDLQRAGKIRNWGVSNFDAANLEDLLQVPGGAAATTDQVLYHLGDRGIEWDLMPRLRAQGMPVMAYCPLGQGQLLQDRALKDFAERHGITAAQAALAWLLSRDDVIAIPRSSNVEHVQENRGALDIELTPAQLAELDDLFPPPEGRQPLGIV